MVIGVWQTSRVGDHRVGFDLFTYRTGEVGPRVAVIGGVHGDEVLGTTAAAQLTSEQDPVARGELWVVPLAHEAAFPSHRASPIDGLNLARTFPGRSDGSVTEQLAEQLTTSVIGVSDYLIDLHTASWELGTDMPVLAGGLDDGTSYGDRCRRLATAFCAPVTWLHPVLGPGRSLSAAHQRDVPAIYVESPDGGRLHQGHLNTYRDGIHRILALLSMRAAAPHLLDTSHTTIRGNEVEVAAPANGLFQPLVDLLDEVVEGQEIGVMLDRRANRIATITSPVGGARVLVLRRRAAAAQGERLVGLVVPGK